MIELVVLIGRHRFASGAGGGVHPVLILLLVLVALTVVFALVFLARRRSPTPMRARVRRVEKPITLGGVGGMPVGVVELMVLRDRSRKKELQLRVSYPMTGDALPVIVFSHGTAGSKDDYQLLIQHWCSHGYLCIQPNHSDAGPLGGRRTPESFRDWASRPHDVSVVIASLNEIARAIPRLRERCDFEHIGVGGHSFGAHTAQLLGGLAARDPDGGTVSYRDPRVSAVLMLSPQGRGRLHRPDAWAEFSVPTMSITGTKDRGRNGEPYTWRLDPFELSPPGDKYLIVIADADHEFGGIPRSSAQFPYAYDEAVAGIVLEESVIFWDAYLKGDLEAKHALQTGRALPVDSPRVERRVK